MEDTLSKLSIGVIASLLTFFVTYFLTSISNDKKFKEFSKETIYESINIHRKIDHKQTLTEAIKTHKDECTASKGYDKVRDALIFMVGQMGGNPADMGL
jgi:hypothetical protein